MMNPRFLAFKLLNSWSQGKGYPEALLSQALSRHPQLSGLDRKLVTELFYGVIRWLNQLDFIIDTLSQVKPSKIDLRVRNLLRLGIYQIWHTRIPDAIAVYETVEVAKKAKFPRWLIRFVNALLRSAVRQKDSLTFPRNDPIIYLSLKYAHPSWLIERWLKEWGEKDTIMLCHFNNQPPEVVIRTNTLKTSRQSLMQSLTTAGIKVKEGQLTPEALIITRFKGSLFDLPGFKSGQFLPQSEVSQVISHLLKPLPGERVLDACAGTGGKTTHLAQLMKNQGQIMAIEPNAQRLKRLKKVVKKMGIDIVYPYQGRLQEVISAFSKGSFDKILIDAPCSGLGVLRQNVDLKWQRRPEDITQLAALQLELLERAAAYLKKGGILLYATCTFTPEENEGVIKELLKRHPQWQIEPIAEIFPQYQAFTTPEGFFKTLPFRHQLPGFFASRMKKLSNN